MATTSTNVSALKASYLVANRIAKAKKPFTIGEELLLPAAKDICCELLGEAAVKKIAQVPLSASTVTRRIENISEDIDKQLLERINKSPPWYAIQVDESTDVDNKATLVYVRYIRKMCRRIFCVHYCCQPTPQPQNCSSVWMIAYQEN